MTSPQPSQPSTPDESPVPLNRAARRAKRKGKAPADSGNASNRDDQLRGSQVIAQQKFKGRRGNR